MNEHQGEYMNAQTQGQPVAKVETLKMFCPVCLTDRSFVYIRTAYKFEFYKCPICKVGQSIAVR